VVLPQLIIHFRPSVSHEMNHLIIPTTQSRAPASSSFRRRHRRQRPPESELGRSTSRRRIYHRSFAASGTTTERGDDAWRERDERHRHRVYSTIQKCAPFVRLWRARCYRNADTSVQSL